ncbi:hypothetical protein [Rubrivirga marina]|uniref:Uncharacterized protein n=1 Tax=Rubrivirga marina TaxID=1196024 RepID=A0A271IWJ5_9BACT|nr:hypothetical protein [Rubrivirga marina]PAP75593.1 hypothetical protein BSZ37_03650 [Rubrivirga marina]
MRILSVSLLLLLVATGCDSAEDVPETGTVLVGNQGIFSDESGSLSRYDPMTGAAEPDAVTTLGGLVQNVEVVDGRLYVFLNFSDSFSTGSGRIAVLDPSTGAVTDEVEVGTPRAWAVVGRTAFVTNLYDATVTPVDLASNTAGTPIAVGQNPEGAAAVGDRVYVTNFSADDGTFGAGNTISVVSASGRSVVETITVEGCDGPRFALADDDGEVWVVCTGRTLYDADFNVVGQTDGLVVVLDGASGEEVARFALDAQVGGGALGTDAAQSRTLDEVYVSLGDRIVAFDTDDNAEARTITPGGPPISAVAFDDDAERFYLGRLDAADGYGSPGTVTVHDRTGSLIDQFDAGVIPTDVAFGPADLVAGL